MEPYSGGDIQHAELRHHHHPGDRRGSGKLTVRLAAFTGGFLRKGHVRRILELSGWNMTVLPGRADAVAVWGRRPVSWRGLAVARRYELPVLNVEDAFLRSVTPGPSTPGMGLLLDRKALHYDATQPSELEDLLSSADLHTEDLTKRARKGIAFLRLHGLSKYSNWDPAAVPPEPGYVLIVDQTAGDAAIAASGANAGTFAAMLVAARAEHPDARIVIRTHPVTASGRRGGHYGPGDLDERTEICATPVNPWDLLENASAVYCVSSQLGFEAILAGHRPVVFGQPFYAGWGLSDDRNPVKRRTRCLTAEALFAGAMLEYPVWYDVYRDRLTDFETVAQSLADQARAWRENLRPVVCAGMKPWKHRPVTDFLRGPENPPLFENDPLKAVDVARQSNRDLVVWAGRETPELRAECDRAQVRLIRMEDGFLRSVGLGAALLPAASLVLDDLGIYFDPTRPSRLEALIAASGTLSEEERGRAASLVERVIATGVTKYNVGKDLELPDAGGRRRVLVPGQVEDDASIRLGTCDVATNLDLLRRARAHFPDAQIIYKPHPDVETGLRKGKVPESDLAKLADVVARDASASLLLDRVDILWTMTSLMGFEALLRGIEVHCLGRPFYAGWGLTQDHRQVFERRTARPDVIALAHAALIAYPRYFDPVTRMACPAEVILDRLAARDAAVASNPARRHRWLAAVQYRLRRFAPLWRR